MKKNNTSGYKGVIKYKDTGRWVAQIESTDEHGVSRRFRKVNIATAEEAAREYDKMSLEHHGIWGCTNVMLGLLSELLKI